MQFFLSIGEILYYNGVYDIFAAQRRKGAIMTENENVAQSQVDQRDDALFETLDKNKRRKKRRVTILLVS